MTQRFRFSPRPNRAHEIHWREWGAAAFDLAAQEQKPILLRLTAVWCPYCQRMDETIFSDDAVIELANTALVPIFVDADAYPHIAERYVVAGWPSSALLTPGGEVLWAGGLLPPAEFLRIGRTVVAQWAERREELLTEIERRRRALDAARPRNQALGLVRRDAADDVLAALRQEYDQRNGGFGEAPKFPHAEAVEWLLVKGLHGASPDLREMAERTLDAMLAAPLWDDDEGGFFRCASAADWTGPHYQKLLDVNAALLRVYALGAQLQGRDDWRRAVVQTVEWVERSLRRPNGLWGGSETADAAYYRARPPDRRRRSAVSVDPVVYTNFNAQWIRALAEAGGRLGFDDWVGRAEAALETLLVELAGPDDLLCHFRWPGGDPELPGLLADTLDTACACVAVAQASGRPIFLDHARRLIHVMEDRFWTAEGGFRDVVRRPGQFGALRYADQPLQQNAYAARLLIDMSLATGERGYRAVAERVLALFSPRAGAYGIEAAVFARAMDEFFEPPMRIVVIGPAAETAALRRTALALPRTDSRVWSLEAGGRIGTLHFPVDQAPAAYVCGRGGRSKPIREAAQLVAATRAAR